MSAARDEAMMKRCLELARSARGRTAPNPMVGCVITDRRGEVIAEGLHRFAGALHAEADALAKLGNRVPAGATLYVNLEPCRHRSGRRTAPCAPLVIDSGVARVVVGMRDPIRGHAGGIRELRSAGIEVVEDVLAKECAELNRAFVTWAKKKRPYLVWKAASSLDARVALRSGASKWITGEAARADGHRLRNHLDAVICGIGTVLADNPALTCRGVVGGRDPFRVIIDSKLRTPPDARFLPVSQPASRARVVIVTTAKAPKSRARRLAEAGAEVWRLGAGPRVDLHALGHALAEAEVTSALLEGGPTLAAAFVAAGLVDELVLYQAPVLLGGGQRDGGPVFFAGPEAASLKAATRWERVGQPEVLGADLRVVYRPA